LWDKLRISPVYQHSYLLDKKIYDFSQLLKNNRDFWIIMDQINRVADSVSANIAEGYGRFCYKDKIRFCYKARGSLLEVCDWLAKTLDRGFVSAEEAEKLKKLINQIFRELESMIFNTKEQC